MWARHYFADRYFAERYFGGGSDVGGGEAPAVTTYGIVPSYSHYQYRDLTRTHSHRTVASTTGAVSLEQVKLFLRVDSDEEDSIIEMFISAATAQCEKLTGRSLITQTWQTQLDAFIDAIELPFPPVQSIASVSYLDDDGAIQTVDAENYYLDAMDPAWLVPAVGFTWPAAREQANAVTITYVTGYGDDPEDIPADIRSWIMLRVGDLFRNRSSIVIGDSVGSLSYVDGLLDPYKIHTLV